MPSIYKLNSLWIGLLVIIAAGCASPESPTDTVVPTRMAPTATRSVISTEPLPTGTPTATPTPISTQCIPHLLPVTDDAVSWAQWSEDGTTLYYNLQDDPDAWWGFNPATKTVISLTTKPVAKEVIPDAVAQVIPDTVNREFVSVSPNGENAVYKVEVYTLPTPTPSDVGESEGPSGFLYELFLVKPGADSPISLGQFEGLMDGFTWFADSSAVLIHNSARIPVPVHTWLADVAQQTVVPLLVATPDTLDKLFVDLSEDGLVLLYQDQQALHLYELSTNTDREILSLPNARFYAWFLDSTHILLVDDMEKSLHFAAHIYDTASDKLSNMGEATFRADEISLSPNKQYLSIVGMTSHELQILPICAPTATPTLTATPTATVNTRHVSAEYLREVIWSPQKKAFILTTWTEGNDWYALSPDNSALVSHASPIPTLDSATAQEIGGYENAAYAIANDGQGVLYHREGESSFELWYANLNSREHYQVMTTTEFYEAGCCIGNIVWLHQDEEALLTQVSGESLIVRRLNVATRQVLPWSDGVTTAAAIPVEDIAPTIITLAPGGTQLAMVSWLMGPQPDQLWILYLVTRELTHIGPAYAGMQPLWSADERYVYYACGTAPHYLGVYDTENPVGIYKFDRETAQKTELLPPGALGSGEIGPKWSISADEIYVVYSVNRGDAEQEGIWLADLN
ncbi:MAG: hypothetical protein JXA21_29430 [Anaerolineae bacterium]|nr:hypothetical protein [Anaerolineae bacterium]